MQISLLIITKKHQESDQALMTSRMLFGEDAEVEILLAEGDNPSMQRNALAAKAKGQYLLFLDNDSEPDQNILKEYIALIKKFPNVPIFGGPSLFKISHNKIHPVLKLFFSSKLGVGPITSRYNSEGEIRFSDEKELILCNMLIKKEYFIKTGGFNKNFYPGEENEFLNRDKSYSAIYTPEAKVYRYPRGSLDEFVMQMFSYGKGRAKHLSFNKCDLIFLLPVLFLIYSVIMLSKHFSLMLVTPLLFYFFVICLVSLLEFGLKFQQILMSLVCFYFGHLAYGAGIIFGLVKYKIPGQGKREITYLNILRIKKFKKVS